MASGAPTDNNGRKLSHSTWHPPRSPAPVTQDGSSSKDGARALHHSPEGASRPRLRKKPSFNMKGLLKSVSSHSFSRRTGAWAGGDAPAAASTEEERAARVERTKGWLLEKQGKLDQAELMYSRDCLRAQKQHGKESLPLAEHLDRLVNLLHKEGKLAEAEPICRRSLDIRRKALGEEDPEVATAMINLARILEAKGDFTKALLYLRKGLAIREKVLEEGHPDTVSALAWIGDIHYKQDEYQEALDIAKRVAAAHEAILGPEDIKVASSLNNVAGLLATLGKPDEALPLFTRANEIYVRHLGENHPRSVATRLWVEQLSAPAPPPRAARPRRRPAPHLTHRSGCGNGNLLTGLPPPLIEAPGEDDVSAHVDGSTALQEQANRQQQQQQEGETVQQQQQQQPVCC